MLKELNGIAQSMGANISYLRRPHIPNKKHKQIQED